MPERPTQGNQQDPGACSHAQHERRALPAPGLRDLGLLEAFWLGFFRPQKPPFMDGNQSIGHAALAITLDRLLGSTSKTGREWR